MHREVVGSSPTPAYHYPEVSMVVKLGKLKPVDASLYQKPAEAQIVRRGLSIPGVDLQAMKRKREAEEADAWLETEEAYREARDYE